MKLRVKHIIITILLFGFFINSSCRTDENTEGKLRVVTTTNILEDLLKQIGGDKIFLQSMMGPGVDPHLYKASEGDVMKLYKADIIFYGGLHLEGKMADIFDQMKKRKTTVGVADLLPKEQLISSKNFGGNYDPHVWFNVKYFKEFAQITTDYLSEADPENSEYYQNNNSIYQKELDELDKEIRETISQLPVEKRILVTAHDAFSYFGREYTFTVVGLQGISTASEAGVRDVQRLKNFIIENNVKAIFVESSVSPKAIEALQAAVRAENHDLEIGGFLYSDALGNPDTDEGTYTGMFLYNVKTIVNALK